MFSWPVAGAPGRRSGQIDRGGGVECAYAVGCPPAVAVPADAVAPNERRQATLDTAAVLAVLFLKRFGCLTGSGGLGLRIGRAKPQRAALFLAGAAARAQRALPVEACREGGLATAVAAGEDHRGVATGTGHLLGLKVNHKVGVGEAVGELRLRRHRVVHRPDQLLAEVLTPILGIGAADIARVDIALARQHAALLLPGADVGQGVVVAFGRWCQVNVGDEVRQALVVGLGDLELVTNPVEASLEDGGERCRCGGGRVDPHQEGVRNCKAFPGCQA